MNRSREEFIDRYMDEMCGWHMTSLRMNEIDETKLKTLDYTKTGRFSIEAMKRARALLGKIWDEDNAVVPKAAGSNGQHVNGQRPLAGAKS